MVETVVLVHGGPGAPGSFATLARDLRDDFDVLEPHQRGSGDAPLTVARHVADLHDVVTSVDGGPPAVVGHSWGAMLALAWAAAHPDVGAPLVLIGCGTFDEQARAELQRRLAVALDGAEPPEEDDPDARLAALGDLVFRRTSHDPVVASPGGTADARAHRETWDDMLRLQADGTYPAAFAAIRAPVLMLHGADDPHPGELIRDGLWRVLPQLEYRAWERCGHYPWLERAVRDDVLAALRAWLAAR